ncbi:MAG: PAS domain-containing protein [Rhodospirillaceae bacterium]
MGAFLVSEELSEKAQLDHRIFLKALSQSEYRIRAFAAAIPDPTFILNAEGTYIEILTPGSTLLISEAQALIGRNVAEFFSEANTEMFLAVIADAIASNETKRVEYSMPVEGVEHWFEASISHIQSPEEDQELVIWVARDIDDRKQAEQALKQRESILNTMLDNMPMIAFLKKMDGSFIRINRRYQEFYGPDPATIAGKTVHDLYPPDLANKLEALDRFAIDAGGRVESEHVLDGLAGAMTLRSQMFPVFDDQGRMIAYGGVEEDISARKRAEQNLADAYAIISDSVDYAAYIQQALLGGYEVISALMEDHMIIWQPRDKVGGDFYWVRVWGDGILIILADCTGHGVPGAFMTLIVSGALERALHEVPAGRVGSLIGQLHLTTQHTLTQDTAKGLHDVGLELGACYIDESGEVLKYAGARLPLFAVKDGEVTEVKGDKTGIGYRGLPQTLLFAETEVPISPGQTFFMVSDGYPDQIGGERRRMFGKKRLKQLLSLISGEPLEAQKQALLSALEDFQGEEARRDDVSVIGFRPL